MAIPPLLDELLRAVGPSGSEGPVQAIVRREAAELGAEITTDVLGGTVARVRGTGSGRVVALVAHTDQVSVGVTRFDDDGRARVLPFGTWDAASAVGQRFSIMTSSGQVPAVGIRAGKGDVTWDDIRLDLGCETKEAARALVTEGDAAVLVGPPVELAAGRIASAAIDDRAGVFVGLEVLRAVAAAPADWDVALVASVQEEGGLRVAAATTMAGLDAEVAIVIEVSYASDAPSGPEPWGEVPLGGGPSVFRGPVVHPVVSEGLAAAIAAGGRRPARETGSPTHSDADEIYLAGRGVATGLVSIPLRHMHSAAEIADLGDIQATIEAVEAYVRALSPEASFLR